MNNTPTGDFDYINDFVNRDFINKFSNLPTPSYKPAKKEEEIRYSDLMVKVSGKIVRDVYNCYVDGMSIENIGAVFDLPEDVNEIIDAINC